MPRFPGARRSAARHLFVTLFFAFVPVLLASPASAATEKTEGGKEATYRFPTDLYGGLSWRFVGPYRGGRVTTVTGVPGAPFTFYMGATGGGVWKTTNAGQTWTNLSDGHFNTTTIGAVAVAPSDPNVVYVGTGESPIRGVTTSHGDGVYKSTDRGQTWTHIGLAASRQIAAIAVHPSDPDRLFVAAQGNPWGASPERGVYRSQDGGASWQRVLHVDDNSGAVDLSMDASNPRVLYAALWDHRRSPWFVQSGGPGSGLHKSTDGGDSWEQLEKGLPTTLGKIGVDVSAADPARVYAIVEAEEGGLYRSDDGGKSWERQNETRVIQARSWYYHHVIADPVDANTVYVLNVPMMKSIDGGKTFTAVTSPPHGDHHDLWINPTDPRIMINGNDGGATVSLDGGATWSTLDNQPTAQLYRVATDDQFPYALYGGQQDNSTLAILSRGPGRGIGRESWHPVGGGESAHIAFDPADPTLVYATTINGEITEFDGRTRRVRSIRPYPEYVFGRDGVDQRYRANWNAPVAISPQDSATLYYGTQILLRSRDRGRSWEEISPDLTRNETAKQGQSGGPITNEQAGAELYNTIFAIAESPHEAGTIWVGSDDGLVHLSRDHGATWADVTPQDAGEALINSIEISPYAPGGAYLAVAGYKLNDFTPRIYKTEDYGRRWQKIITGLPTDTFVRAVRADPDRHGLLYAATETGVFVSFDDGAGWQPLQGKLPEVPITDLAIRRQDLVAATQGRGFWILDDLTPLHQLDDNVADASLHLFAPRAAYRLAASQGQSSTFSGKNPPNGAVLHYILQEERDENATPISLEILDADGAVIRTFSSEETERDRCMQENTERRNRGEIDTLSTSAGMSRWVWDLRREGLRCIPDLRLFAGFRGARVAPGTYQARLRADEQEISQRFEVRPDPRYAVSAAAWAEHERVLDNIAALFDDLAETVGHVRAARTQIRDRLARTADLDTAEALRQIGDELVERLSAWEEEVVQPRHETFDDDINWPNMLDVQIRFLYDDTDDAGPPLRAGTEARLADLQNQWAPLQARAADLLGKEVQRFNEALETLGAAGVYVAKPPL